MVRQSSKKQVHQAQAQQKNTKLAVTHLLGHLKMDSLDPRGQKREAELKGGVNRHVEGRKNQEMTQGLRSLNPGQPG
jgi:hypothetical protein